MWLWPFNLDPCNLRSAWHKLFSSSISLPPTGPIKSPYPVMVELSIPCYFSVLLRPRILPEPTQGTYHSSLLSTLHKSPLSKAHVSLSQDWQSHVPQTRWLETTDINDLTDLKSEVNMSTGWAPLKALKQSVPCLFWLLVAASVPLCHLAGSDFTSVIGVMVQSQKIWPCYRLNSHVASEFSYIWRRDIEKEN